MQRFVNNLALLFSLCLMGMVSGAFAACTPIQQGQVAPGDIIDLSGPDVPADQQALGVHWDYYWTVKEEDASGKTVATFNTKSISYTVPTSEYAKNYYFELMVTAREAQLCINQACVTFPIVKPGPCTIKTEAPHRSASLMRMNISTAQTQLQARSISAGGSSSRKICPRAFSITASPIMLLAMAPMWGWSGIRLLPNQAHMW